MKLYVVGWFKRLESELPHCRIWELMGVFDTKEKAVAICRHPNVFIGEVELNKDLGDQTMQWPNCWYPHGHTDLGEMS